ncbi:MAG: ABC transporter permease, partial [Longimicrobiales bacterium]
MQVALTTVLLFGSLLVARSLLILLRTPTGFQPGSALTFALGPPRWRYDAAGARRFQEQVVARLEGVPGVQAVGLVSDLLFTPSNVTIDVAVPDGTLPVRESEEQAVNPQYFASLGIPLLRGRNLNPSDDASAVPVALVNLSLAVLMAPNGDAVGRHLRIGAGTRTINVQIVGVVGDVLDDGFRGRREPRVYRAVAAPCCPCHRAHCRGGAPVEHNHSVTGAGVGSRG